VILYVPMDPFFVYILDLQNYIIILISLPKSIISLKGFIQMYSVFNKLTLRK